MANTNVAELAGPQGANAAQNVNQVGQEATNWMGGLMQKFQQTYGEQQDVVNQMMPTLGNILAGNLNYGYSPQLDSLLQANVLQTGATATANALNAARLSAQQESGGAATGPQGADLAREALVQAVGQQKTAEGLQAEKRAGYGAGLTEAEAGLQAGNELARTLDPTALAGQATEAGKLKLSAGEEQFKEQQATSPLAIAGQVIGDIGKVEGDITGMGDIGSMFQNVMNTGSKSSGGYQNPTLGLEDAEALS